MDNSIHIQVRHQYQCACNFNQFKRIINLRAICICILIVAARWRKHRRQYLSKMLRPFSSIGAITSTAVQTNGPVSNSANHLHRRLEYGNNDETDFNGSAFLEESSSLGGAGDTSDSKDSQHLKEDIGKSIRFMTLMPNKNSRTPTIFVVVFSPSVSN